MFHRLAALVTVVCCALLSAACGARTRDVHIYRIAVVDDTDSLTPTFRELVSQFNESAGAEIIAFVESSTDANSTIRVIPGLSGHDGKVGYGEWKAVVEEDRYYHFLKGRGPRRVRRHTMNLEFDRDYFVSRMQNPTRKGLGEIKTLGFHEMGHGVGLDHVDDMADVMYPSIVGEKDYGPFFDRVRQVLAL